MSMLKAMLMASMMGKKKLNPLIKKVGTPTITNDFIYKDVLGTSSYNRYIYIDEVMPLQTANNWKIQVKWKYGIDTSYPYNAAICLGYIGGNSYDGYSPVLRCEGSYISSVTNKLRPLISSAGNHSWDINVSVVDYTFVVGTEYYLEYGFTGTEYYVKDLDTDTDIWRITNSNKCQCSNKFSLLWNSYGPDCEYSSGEMDLNKFKIYINDNLYFSAVI